MSEKDYNDDVLKLRQYLCNYVNSDGGKNCLEKQGKSISPIGRDTDGAKLLKVRWDIFNAGKSSGFRFIFALYCTKKIAFLKDAVIRKNA